MQDVISDLDIVKLTVRGEAEVAAFLEAARDVGADGFRSLIREVGGGQAGIMHACTVVAAFAGIVMTPDLCASLLMLGVGGLPLISMD